MASWSIAVGDALVAGQEAGKVLVPENRKTMSEIGKLLIIIGLVLAAIGAVVVFGAKIPWIGKLPGDIVIQRPSFRLYFPLTTCILISIILTVLFHLFRK